MKTPWRFVADLVSRKPTAKPTDLPGRQPDEVKALGYSPVVDEPAGEAATVIPEQPAAAQPIDDAETRASSAEVAAVETGEGQAPTETDVVPEEATVAPSVIAGSDAALAHSGNVVEPAAERKRKQKVAAAQEVTDSHVVPATPPTGAHPKTFVEEMAVLDTEVADLRRQLAGKLVEQNAQLRKMLARFEQR